MSYSMMRSINLIVIHCSATREDKSFTEYDLDVCHRRRGFNGTGYHFYIRKNGDIKSTRPIEKIGAHVRGFNSESIGICYEGGLDCEGQPKDTRTEWQKHSLRVLILTLLRDYPGCRVCGHRDLSPDLNGRNGSRLVLASMLKPDGTKSERKRGCLNRFGKKKSPLSVQILIGVKSLKRDLLDGLFGRLFYLVFSNRAVYSSYS